MTEVTALCTGSYSSKKMVGGMNMLKGKS